MDGRRSIMLIMNRCRCERSTNQRYEMNRVIRELNLSKDRAINRLEKKKKEKTTTKRESVHWDDSGYRGRRAETKGDANVLRISDHVSERKLPTKFVRSDSFH